MIMTIYMAMIMVNVHEAKARLSEYLDAAERGERVVICRRNRPIAELHRSTPTHPGPRPIGLDQGRFEIPDTFFDPLPDETLEAWTSAGDASPKSDEKQTDRRSPARTRRTR